MIIQPSDTPDPLGPAGLGNVPTLGGSVATAVPDPVTGISSVQVQQSSNTATQAAAQAIVLPPIPYAVIHRLDPSGALTMWLQTLVRKLGGFTATPWDDAQILDFQSDPAGQQMRDVMASLQMEGSVSLPATQAPEDPWPAALVFPPQDVVSTLWDDLPKGPIYSAGSWTPTIIGSTTAGTQTYTTQVGSYTRMGRIVVAACRVTLSGTAGAVGNVLIGGLPVPGAAAGFRTPVRVINVANLTGYTPDMLVNSFVGASTNMSLIDSAAGSPVPVSALTATTSLDLQVIYQV